MCDCFRKNSESHKGKIRTEEHIKNNVLSRKRNAERKRMKDIKPRP